jgi:transposase-like protein
MLKRADAGESIVDICRSTGISDTTFARWRAKYGGLDRRVDCGSLLWGNAWRVKSLLLRPVPSEE